MKPLTDNIRRMLAVLAERDGHNGDNLSTLNALQSRGLCKVSERWARWRHNHLEHTAVITDAGRKLAAELARETTEKGGAK